eukprot:SAG11_NODE_21551_length_423_cov_0.685185_1_plen_83_part_00
MCVIQCIQHGAEATSPEEAKSLEPEVLQFLAEVWNRPSDQQFLQLAAVALQLQKNIDTVKDRVFIKLATANITFGQEIGVRT